MAANKDRLFAIVTMAEALKQDVMKLGTSGIQKAFQELLIKLYEQEDNYSEK